MGYIISFSTSTRDTIDTCILSKTPVSFGCFLPGFSFFYLTQMDLGLTQPTNTQLYRDIILSPIQHIPHEVFVFLDQILIIQATTGIVCNNIPIYQFKLISNGIHSLFMKNSIFLLFLLSLAISTPDSPLTFQLTHLNLDHIQSLEYVRQTSHLRHFTAEDGVETYPLHSLKTIFTLSINFNGFDYNLSVDTGSSDLFIKGEELEGNPLRKFSCKKCVEENQYVKIGYLDGKLDTYVYNSTVTLGKHTFNETILVAYATDRIINFRKIGGIVGLSFQQISRNPYPNFISTLIKEKIISKYRFGLKMNFKDPESSFISFGGVDHKYVDPADNISYYDIIEGKFTYQINVTRVKFGDQTLNIQVALLDSGNTCVSIDAEYTDHMLKEMNKENNKCQFKKEAGNDMFKILICHIEDFDLLPEISVEMPDGKVLTWEKEYYIDKCTENGKNQNGAQIYSCDTFIESVTKSRELFLGAAWMLKYYSVFDLDSRKIGMAKNIDNPTLKTVLDKARGTATEAPKEVVNPDEQTSTDDDD